MAGSLEAALAAIEGAEELVDTARRLVAGSRRRGIAVTADIDEAVEDAAYATRRTMETLQKLDPWSDAETKLFEMTMSQLGAFIDDLGVAMEEVLVGSEGLWDDVETFTAIMDELEAAVEEFQTSMAEYGSQLS
ncbi:hypothetical protein GP486_008146 [Trichoglossum hirsutum]|uniref:Uncharacterized protein n=1 Tax=Trichoglossum hirsutum TaxID=265104 RepID=A0A9P8IAI9_9PEZI|nr:hypothetical protein GP486_008146 [Trichoglossum hirsutum]